MNQDSAEPSNTFSLKYLFFWFTLIVLLVAVISAALPKPKKRMVTLFRDNVSQTIVEIQQGNSVANSTIQDIYISCTPTIEGKSGQAHFSVDSHMQVKRTRAGKRYLFIYLERARGGAQEFGIGFDTVTGKVVLEHKDESEFLTILKSEFADKEPPDLEAKIPKP